MIREDFFHQTPSGIVVPGSMRFTYLAEVVAKAYEPTQSQLDALQSAYEATGNFLIECPEFEKQLVEVHAQGSRQMGTIVRPTELSREGFDIDLVATESVAAYKVCKERIDAVELALKEALADVGTESSPAPGAAGPGTDATTSSARPAARMRPAPPAPDGEDDDVPF